MGFAAVLSGLREMLRGPVLDRWIHVLIDSPPLWAIVWLTPLLVLAWAMDAVAPLRRLRSYSAVVLLLLAAGSVLALVWTSWRYALSPNYLDHVEPNVAEVSWYFWTGRPVYHAAGDPLYYNTLAYGPVAYMLIGTFMGVAGPSIMTSKLPTLLAVWGTLAVAYAVFRRSGSRMRSLFWVGLLAALLLYFTHRSFWVRPDPFLIFFVALAFAAATSTWKAAPLWIGLAAGAAAGLKVHGIVYFVPVFAAAWRTQTHRRFAVAIAITAAGAAAPFLFPSISLSNYVSLLRAGSKHGMSFGTYTYAMTWVCTILAPALVVAIAVAAHDSAHAARLARLHGEPILIAWVGVFLLLLPAAKIGAGPHHFLPYIAVMLFVGAAAVADVDFRFADLARGRLVAHAALGSWLLCVFGIGLYNARDLRWQTMGAQTVEGRTMVAELHDLQRTQANRYVLLAGLGQPYHWTWYRPVLVFGGSPIAVDTPSVMDFKLAEEPRPDFPRTMESLQQVTGGRSVAWVIPKDAVPFLMVDWGPTFTSIHRRDFLEAFNRSFVRAPSLGTPHFDLYVPRQ